MRLFAVRWPPVAEPKLFQPEIDVMVETTLPDEADVDGLAKLMEYVLEREHVRGEWPVALVLTTDDELRVLHRDYMGIDAETDVITFPASDAPELGGGGDIAISVDRAAAQAPEFGGTAWSEIRFLAVHGVLHLCGWDDASDDARKAMLDRQAELIADFDRHRNEPTSAL